MDSRPQHVTSSGYEPMGPVSVWLAVLSVVLWGGTAVANQFAIDVYPPLQVGAIRFGMAAVFMWGWCRISGDAIGLPPKQLAISTFIGVLMFLQIGTFNVGTAWSSASHATVLVNSYIFWVVAIEVFLLRSMILAPGQLLGFLLSGGGVMLLVMTAGPHASGGIDPPSFEGDLVLALSGLILGIKILCVKWATQHVAPAPLIFWHDVSGSLFLWGASQRWESPVWKPPTWPAASALLFGGIVISGLCFVLNAQLLQRHGAAQVSVFSFITPVCGIALASLMRGDRLTPWLLAAGACVAAGIYLVNKRPRSKRHHPDRAEQPVTRG